MYWQEESREEAYTVPQDVVDLLYGIRCRCLPVDHAYALYKALHKVLPWLAEEEFAGVHPIHVADSGNGWMRPEGPDDLLHFSRRTKLILRVPQHRVAEAKALVGESLDVTGNELRVEKVALRPLSTITTLFSRYIVNEDAGDEEAFMQRLYQQLQAMGIKPPKMLAGRQHTISTPEGGLAARSLMLAGLAVEDSIGLQQKGLGSHRHLGCGLFIPHKDINEVGRDSGGS